ncbi:MAG: virulence factor [Paracoccaceae bacterium]|nr:virulence factor [Paracoccaceae bacterium]MDG1936765.1 virulence factor [Paracoccaceae bacterium]
MTKITLLCWQEIPSVVEARDGPVKHKVELTQRFQELIDLIAMKRGLDGSDDYLMHWVKEKQDDSDEAPIPAAEKMAAKIEAEYSEVKSRAIANS